MRAGRKRALKWVFYSFVLVLLPWLPTILAYEISSMWGCVLHEGGVNACVVFGQDIGRTLYKMNVFGWVAVFISPIFMLIFVLCLIYLLKELVLPSGADASNSTTVDD